MIYVVDGDLYQWDLGRKLEIVPKDRTTVEYIHFNNGLVVEAVKVKNHYTVAIPNILLQSSKNIAVYAVMVSEDSTRTTEDCIFSVKEKEKPDDYVYTETEVLTYKALADKLDEVLENLQIDPEDVQKAVAEYLEANPVEAPVSSVNGKTGEVQLTAEDIGAIPTERLPEVVNDALRQAKASGEFNGEDGYTPQKGIDYFDGKNGEDGKTPEKGVDYFTEEDKSELVTDVLNSLPAWNGGAY